MNLLNKTLVALGLKISDAEKGRAMVLAKHLHPSMKVSDCGALTKDIQACLRDNSNEA